MTTELAVDEFLSLAQQSGIISDDQMQRLLEEMGDRRADFDTARKVAEELVGRDVLTRWQAAKLLGGKHKGFVLGPYQILEPLGKGGMGTVFLAEHKMMRRRCAIKVLPSRTDDAASSTLERFYREAQAVAALDHPNIVRAYDVNSAVQNKTEIHYLVMEYIEGYELQKMVDEQGVLDYRQAAEYVRQAAEGLTHAHQAGLVHRDVKPANLLVDRSGVVKILDLGLARFFDDGGDASLTNEHGETVLGTADYLAPEQALDCHDVDARADVYSLGQTFYFFLTGHPPFPEGSVAQRLMAHQMKSPEPIENERPDAPPTLLAIIEKMIAKKPEDRFQTAQEVSQALQEWLHHPDDSGFFRRSALLRAAKPPARSPPEPTQPASRAVEDTDLELAPLDDEKPVSSGSGRLDSAKSDSAKSDSAKKEEKKNAAEEQQKGSSQLTSVPDDASLLSVLGDSPLDELADDGQSGLSENLSDLFPLGNESIAELLGDESLSASDASLAAVSGSLPKPNTRKTSRGKPGSLVSSPAFWITVAVVFVVALLMAIVLTSLPADDVSQGPQAHTSRYAQPNVQSESSAEEDPLVEGGGTQETAHAPEQQPPTETTGRGEVSLLEDRPDATGASNNGTIGVRQTAEKPTRNKKQPDSEQGTAAAKENQKQLTPAESRRILAGLETVSFQLKSADRNPNSKFNMMIQQIAIQAAGRVGMTPGQDDNAVMYIEMKLAEAGQLTGVVMSAELKCRTADSGEATLWQHEEQVGTFAQHLLRRSTLPTTLRSDVSDFFDKFVAHCRESRVEAGDEDR